MSTEQKTTGRRILSGTVVSDKMDKTVTVQVVHTLKHPKYRKFITRMKRYKAHDEANTCKVNDVVVIEECRPLSATKRWRVVSRTATVTTDASV